MLLTLKKSSCPFKIIIRERRRKTEREADTERERKRNSKKEEDKRQGGEREENKRTQKPQVKTFLNPFSSHLKFFWIKVESLSSLGDEKLVLVGKFQFSSILPMINEPCMHSICCGI